MELKNRFEDLEAVLYSQIWPDRTVADGDLLPLSALDFG